MVKLFTESLFSRFLKFLEPWQNLWCVEEHRYCKIEPGYDMKWKCMNVNWEKFESTARSLETPSTQSSQYCREVLQSKSEKKAEFALMINHSLTLLPFFPFQLSSSAEKFLLLWMLDVFSHVGRKINMKCPMIHLDFHSWQHLWKLTFVLLSVQKLSPGRKQVHISQSSTTFSIKDSCSVAAEIFVFVSRGWEKNGHTIYRQ